jgi:hypothetical protein
MTGTLNEESHEYLRWLTQRGNNKGGKHVPVFQWNDLEKEKKTITINEAINQLEAKYIEVYENLIWMNVKRVEDGIQKAIDHLPLGMRCHREVAKGKQMDSNNGITFKKVFITYIKAESYDIGTRYLYEKFDNKWQSNTYSSWKR